MKNYSVADNLSKETLIACGFRYNGIDNIFRFGAYNYKKKPVIFVDIIINLPDRDITYAVKRLDEKLYHPYYNDDEKKNKVNKVIRKNIETELDKLVKKEILKNED